MTLNAATATEDGRAVPAIQIDDYIDNMVAVLANAGPFEPWHVMGRAYRKADGMWAGVGAPTADKQEARERLHQLASVRAEAVARIQPTNESETN